MQLSVTSKLFNIIHFYRFTVKTVAGGCLHPMGVSFLSNQKGIEQYLPEDFTILAYDFAACSGSNCNDFTPEGK